MLTKNRFITLAAMSIMALALVAASACGSDSKSPGGIEHVADDAAGKVAAANENDPTTIEPTDPGAVSMGMPIAGDLGADNDMIVVLDGALGSEGIPDPTDGTRLNDDELFPNGESRGGADPLDTDAVNDLPILIAEPSTDPAVGEDVEISDGLPLASGVINPDSCANVLPPASEPFEIKTRSATDSAKSDNPAVITMCTPWYVSDLNEHSASVALITMNSDESAMAHYELLQNEFSQGGIKFDEQRSGNQDSLTATIDQGGIGAMAVVRIGSDLISVHNGPTSDQKEWNINWMLEIAHDTLDRLQ
jgi:hypothetical protein